MPCNIGKVDIWIRVVLGLVLVFVAAYLQSIVVGALGVIALATGMTRFCPLYLLFKLNTGCKE
ncbi:MAG: DUF2892 domain-containing protein [Campylobacterales bacterium]